MNIVTPSNKSWTYFKNSWKPCVFGGLGYLLKHPIKAPKTLYHRLAYPILKKSVEESYTTPEGFKINSNQEMLIHAQMFIEQGLYDKKFLQEFKNTSNATVLDVGANHGMFTAWLGSFNDTPSFICCEPYEQFYKVGRLNTSHLKTQWHNAAVSDACGEIDLYLGGLVSCQKPSIVKEQHKLQCISIDSLGITPWLIKIDTDGHSCQVLDGAKETLPKTRYVIIEIEENIDFDKVFPAKQWDIKLLPSGVDYLFTNKLVPPSIH